MTDIFNSSAAIEGGTASTNIATKEFDNNNDKLSKKTKVNQLIDILQIDMAGKDSNGVSENTRKKYEVFVTGGLGLNSVTSSMFQTVFDQDYTLQTSNELLDLTIGNWFSGSTVQNTKTGEDASGKLLFPSSSLMMREKIEIYRHYAKNLLNSPDGYFVSPYHESPTSSTWDSSYRIDDAIFINIKRLFARDRIYKKQFVMRMYQTGSQTAGESNIDTTPSGQDLHYIKDVSSTDVATVGTNPNIGTFSNLYNEAGSPIGLIYYDKAMIVLDAARVLLPSQIVTGSIQTVGSSTEVVSASFIPDFWSSGSIDQVIDHICETRFDRGNTSSIVFLNQTDINTTTYYCRVNPNEYNFSTNPTYIDENGSFQIIEEEGDEPFTYITSVGLYDESHNLLAVAKLSRPVEKNPDTDLTISVRLDF